MWNTRSVQLNVRLPQEVAAEVEKLQRSNPDLLSRFIQHGLARCHVYQGLRELEERDTPVTPLTADAASGFLQP